MSPGQSHRSVLPDTLPMVKLPETPRKLPENFQKPPSLPALSSPQNSLPNLTEAVPNSSSKSSPTTSLFQEICKNECDPRLTVDEDETQAELLKDHISFREQFGKNAKPKDVLGIIENLRNWKGPEYYLCFHLTYPLAAKRAEALCECISALYLLLDLWMRSYSDPLRALTDDQNQSIKRRLERFRYSVRTNDLYPKWTSDAEKIHDAVRSLAQAWTELKADISRIKEPPRILQEIRQNMDLLSGILKAEMDNLKNAEETARIAYESAQEKASTTSSEDDDPAPGIGRTGSSSTGLDVPGRSKNLRSRSPLPYGVRSGKLLPGPRSEGKRHRSLPKRIKYQLGKLRSKVNMEMLGHRYSAYFIVLIFAITGAVTTGIAAKECSASGSGPIVDSNFWSTLSQSLVGLAGLYCIIIPILRRAKIKARDPRIFKILLALSLVTGVVSVIIYPFQTRASLVLAFVSSLAQLAATLQLIEDSGNTITSANEEIDFLEGELRRQRNR